MHITSKQTNCVENSHNNKNLTFTSPSMTKKYVLSTVGSLMALFYSLQGFIMYVFITIVWVLETFCKTTIYTNYTQIMKVQMKLVMNIMGNPLDLCIYALLCNSFNDQIMQACGDFLWHLIFMNVGCHGLLQMLESFVNFFHGTC